MPPELLILLERFVTAVERIADALEDQVAADDPDAEQTTYLDGSRVP